MTQENNNYRAILNNYVQESNEISEAINIILNGFLTDSYHRTILLSVLVKSLDRLNLSHRIIIRNVEEAE